ncbi:AraC family transcriptional regulator [Phytopseudomonas dryadis]|uniref:DUF4440 domain-containing protein n=1 Tax=Phytopseudomonas dryadis TaxID=2487520 RepID=A0A4Q9R7G6_9GAMM|nr:MULTISPECIES: nuclear transport factor 2 family protein [Pseudomonas]TBU95846.1 DUF4440 domain-containing protein [Pseudomonas dryadis]TBV09009.1 DUF4440 domain-containing protein [Pseudomonas dryadis]TBV18224.1 DUF4440 domain-containing protein [Pseudomonas sp. FRB 230]
MPTLQPAPAPSEAITREVVERYHALWIAKDGDGLMAMFHPQIEYFDFFNNQQIPLRQLHHYVCQSFPQGPSQHITYTDQIRVAGDTAFIQYEARLNMPRGQLASLRVCEAITVRDRLIWRVHEYASRLRESGDDSGVARLGLSARAVQMMLLDLQHYFNSERPYLDAELSLAKVADALGYTRNQVSHLLNQVLGMNFYQYLNNARLDELFLRHAQQPQARLEDLALAVGFNSLSVFYRCFRERTGRTPKAWRADHRENS